MAVTTRSVDQSGQVIFDAELGQNVKHQCCIKVTADFWRSLETLQKQNMPVGPMWPFACEQGNNSG